MGTAPQYTAIANSALAGAASTTNTAYQNQLDRYKANQASSSGVGSLIGNGLGFLAKSYDSDGKFASKVGDLVSGIFAEEGGAVPGRLHEAIRIDRAGVPDEMHAGIRVTREMSPSGGAETDDVPARLNAGEFILPADTVRWVGEKHLQQLIAKSGEERQKAGAKPRVQALPVERPMVNTTGALSVQR